jgi:hypothetical protein
VGEDGQHQSQEATEVLAVGGSRRGRKPRKFKHKELQELLTASTTSSFLIIKDQRGDGIQEDADPSPQLPGISLCVHKALGVNQLVELLRLALKCKF